MTDKLNKVYEVKTGHGDSLGLQLVTACYDAPTFTLEDVNGKQIHWREDLCKEATQEQEVEYWKQRALAAEKRARSIGIIGALGYGAQQNTYQVRARHGS